MPASPEFCDTAAMRNLFILPIWLAAGAACAAPAATCHSTDMSLAMLSNFATGQRYAEACGVPQSAIDRELVNSIKLLRTCLEARNVPAASIDQALQNGTKLGDQALPAALKDPVFCPRIKGGFGKAG